MQIRESLETTKSDIEAIFTLLNNTELKQEKIPSDDLDNNVSSDDTPKAKTGVKPNVDITKEINRIRRGFSEEKVIMREAIADLQKMIKDSVQPVHGTMETLTNKFEEFKRDIQDMVESRFDDMAKAHENNFEMLKGEFKNLAEGNIQEIKAEQEREFENIKNELNTSLSQFTEVIRNDMEIYLDYQDDLSKTNVVDACKSVEESLNRYDNSVNTSLTSVLTTLKMMYHYTIQGDEKILVSYMDSNVRIANLSWTDEEILGRLEVFHDNQWGVVCDDNFYHSATDVACKMFDFIGNGDICCGQTGKGVNKPIWLDNMQCRGGETSIFECDFPGFGLHDCGPEEAVGVRCLL